MTADDRLGEHLLENQKQVFQSPRLCRCACVSRSPQLIQSALVADADGTAVIWLAVRSHLQQAAVLGQRPVLTDIEMIPDGAEPARLMVAQHLSHRIVMVTSCGRAVKNQETYALRGVHHLAVLHSGEELVLTEHLVPTDSHRKQLFYHSRLLINGEQLVTPNAVSAAIAA